MNEDRIKFYIDTLVVETMSRDNSFVKQAGAISDLIQRAKDYINSKIDPNDKVGSVVNLLAPGAISAILYSLGFTWISVLLGLAMKVFNIDVASAIRSICSTLKSWVLNEKPISSSKVDSVVANAIKEHHTPLSPDKEESALEEFSKKTSMSRVSDARLVKLMITEYSINKNAIGVGTLAAAGLTPQVISVITSILSWIFKIILWAGGLMIAGDAINSFLGKSYSITTPSTPKKSTEFPASLPTPKQTKFKLNSSYNTSEQYTDDNRFENYMNTSSGIKKMLLDFTHQIYSGLEGMDNIIQSTPEFLATADLIASRNSASKGDRTVFIPELFMSKKQIVDSFIDSIAAKIK